MYSSFLLTALCVAPLSHLQVDQNPRGLIVVHVPSAVQLFIDNMAGTQTGEVRKFATPPLSPGYVYYFTLRVEAPQDKQIFYTTKKVAVRPGATTTVHFTDPRLLPPAKPANQQPGLAAKLPAVSMTREEQEVISLTNKERQTAGLPPLQANAKLTQAARAHSVNMARQQKMDHVLDEKGPLDRVRAAGYTGFNWGENIAYGMPTPAQAVSAWMNSEGHRANILSDAFNEIGVGIVTDARGVPYFTQVFGRSES